MAKAAKTPKPRAKKYDEKLAVKPGSFLDVIKASVQHADEKKAAKKG